MSLHQYKLLYRILDFSKLRHDLCSIAGFLSIERAYIKTKEVLFITLSHIYDNTGIFNVTTRLTNHIILKDMTVTRLYVVLYVRVVLSSI